MSQKRKGKSVSSWETQASWVWNQIPTRWASPRIPAAGPCPTPGEEGTWDSFPQGKVWSTFLGGQPGLGIPSFAATASIPRFNCFLVLQVLGQPSAPQAPCRRSLDVGTHRAHHFCPVLSCAEGRRGTIYYHVLCLTIGNTWHLYLPQDNVQICFTGFPKDNHDISFFLPF